MIKFEFEKSDEGLYLVDTEHSHGSGTFQTDLFVIKRSIPSPKRKKDEHYTLKVFDYCGDFIGVDIL